MPEIAENRFCDIGLPVLPISERSARIGWVKVSAFGFLGTVVMYVHQIDRQASKCRLLNRVAKKYVHVHMKEIIRGRRALAAELAVSERLISDWLQKRLIPYMKVGRVLLFDREKVLASLSKFERKEASVR